ncbi:UDP-N-acetylmuramate dehydrogenase [Abyssalbus ytuae]|uniref:UDP-N-acetylenolpyruvoylglucosamine reductase n=1 Tax=Abyssalbus ytuae TaxID=2926907 RepID=A0A9E7CTW7_9FLAO|nr:UDP-N-acetylmuramate dehydrogenase [Abyssalbus ytuae]UOB16992.1 UDP-N-acetylmuramate dehydrogenase [Abyssalbus ytuae]
MPEIKHNISLKNYNTFGIDIKAKNFISVNTVNDLEEVLKLQQYPEKFVLGGGSNVLLTKNVDALVIHINIKGIELISETNTHVLIKAKAGENWHEFVLWTLKQNYGGLENLSLIPGNVGTAPIQNIGAYGVELKDSFHECDVINIKTQDKHKFSLKECHFGYRDSIFKNKERGKYIITSVTFKLTKNNHHFNTSYGAIQERLNELGITNPTLKDISNAVISIRKSKLPDPKEIGNSGSFFKNPVISKNVFKDIVNQFPNAPHYILNDSEIKLPAGWLIEQCGYKGKRYGDAGVHEKQALVLVNYGNATGKEIIELAEKIQKSVKEKFNIHIEPEVNII